MACSLLALGLHRMSRIRIWPQQLTTNRMSLKQQSTQGCGTNNGLGSQAGFSHVWDLGRCTEIIQVAARQKTGVSKTCNWQLESVTLQDQGADAWICQGWVPTITGKPLQGCDIGVRGKQNKKPKKPSKKRHSDHLQFSGTFSHTATWDSRSPTLIVSHCIATCCFIPSVFPKWEVQKEQLWNIASVNCIAHHHVEHMCSQVSDCSSKPTFAIPFFAPSVAQIEPGPRHDGKLDHKSNQCERSAISPCQISTYLHPVWMVTLEESNLEWQLSVGLFLHFLSHPLPPPHISAVKGHQLALTLLSTGQFGKTAEALHQQIGNFVVCQNFSP